MVLKFFLDMWSGGTLKEQMKPTDSNRVRAIGLLFQEDMREYIPYVLSGSDRSNRLAQNEWTGKRKLCYHLLSKRFVDEEYNATLPPKWSHENTKKKIDEKAAVVGKTWDQFNKEFNPNDPARISLPRTEACMKTIVGTTVSAYNLVMTDYTKNTGGGDGDDAAIVIWEEREEADIVNYDRKVKMPCISPLSTCTINCMTFRLLLSRNAFHRNFRSMMVTMTLIVPCLQQHVQEEVLQVMGTMILKFVKKGQR